MTDKESETVNKTDDLSKLDVAQTLAENQEKTTRKLSKHKFMVKINMNVLKLWTKLKLKCVKHTVDGT